MYKISLGQERYIRDLSRLREMCEIFVFDSDVWYLLVKNKRYLSIKGDMWDLFLLREIRKIGMWDTFLFLICMRSPCLREMYEIYFCQERYTICLSVEGYTRFSNKGDEWAIIISHNYMISPYNTKKYVRDISLFREMREISLYYEGYVRYFFI